MHTFTRRFIGFSVIACGLWGLACGNARYVMRDGNGGVIAISANTESLREKAFQKMTDQCPGGFLVDREEEVQVGTVTSSNTTYGTYNTYGSQQTRAETEWRITFHCK